MKKAILILAALMISTTLPAQEEKVNPYVEISQNLLKAMRDKNTNEAEKYVRQIAEIQPEAFKKSVNSQEEKLAFWLNTYNGLIQYVLTKNPELFEDRGDFFGDDNVTVLQHETSFDQLEHGIMRRGTSKFSKGYFKNPFRNDWYKQYQVEKIDWRIHFALNCGAASCPPVRIYDDRTVNKQLSASAKQYLDSQVRYDKAENEVFAPALMNWFVGDFGGKDKVIKILTTNGYIPKDQAEDVDLEHNDYDWTLQLGTFYKD